MVTPSRSVKPLQPPLHLIIRFSNSLPDLSLDIPNPAATTVLSLKQILRARLSTPNRLRLIYQGRLLPDASALSSVLKAPAPPPKNDSDGRDKAKGKGKGKGVAGQEVVRVYVNCSIGDKLSVEELEKEKAEAEAAPAASENAAEGSAAGRTSTRPRPRGFERLLSSGFNRTEIAALRTQFSSIHASHYPPDAPPSPDTLRSMEDAWIDSNAGEGTNPSGGPTAEDTTGLAYNIDGLVQAMMVGFFFPLGCMTWLARGEELWSDNSRWKFFVVVGCAFSLITGIFTSISEGPVTSP
ncbi:hypothetical protein N3K66_003889 [Trichothecium roseum]|uniref:Uncharacterized protein n=1 Tax=Trichothecium roseum TaxID=47278 RepID=A0ACC0V8H1_9HYPO|nr:hypothetical protein N3K66_003889 [Trichothecium roseum]